MRFDYNDYLTTSQHSFGLVISSQDEYDVVARYLDSLGKHWNGGKSYVKFNPMLDYLRMNDAMVLYFNGIYECNTFDGLRTALKYCNQNDSKYPLLYFKDFSWDEDKEEFKLSFDNMWG